MSSKKPKTIDPDKVDPSVYYYDEVYDEMKEDEEDKNRSTKNDSNLNKPRTSKYIQGLQETADLRKTEKELRRFKKYARDREEVEKDAGTKSNNDDHVYITEGYRKKLKEMKLLEEDKRKLLEHEKDNTMNFLKKFKNDIDDYFDKKDLDNTSTNKLANEDKKINIEPLRVEGPQLLPEKKKLKTLRDRREYLRKVLSKRTVGKVFDDAVKRYKERKAKIT